MKEIKDFPGYFVTEDGKVYSAWRTKSLGVGKGSKSFLDYENLRELKASINKTTGYIYLILRKDKNRVTKLVHRLVAETYVKNENNLPEVNHIDENKLNNHITNLEWTSRKQNAVHTLCRFQWVIENILTDEIIEITNLADFCKINNLNSGSLYGTLIGRQNQHKNFRVIRKNRFK